MYKFLVLVACLGLTTTLVMAQGSLQDNSRIDLFGGYQYLQAGQISGLEFSGSNGSANTNGWDASATANISRRFGVTADFSGSYNAGPVSFLDTRVYSYTFGPVVSLYSADRIKLFTRALFGGAHLRPGACLAGGNPSECGSLSGNDLSYSGFAMMLGGGVEVRARKRFGWITQADWAYLPLDRGAGYSGNNVRVSTGGVVHF